MFKNTTTLMLVFMIGFIVGSIFGSLIYHFIIYKFNKDVKKQLENTIRDYENFVIEKLKTTTSEFEDLNKKIISISDDIIKEQNLSIEAIRELSDEMLLFNNELKENSKIRFTLENEIIKLKSIINRKNKEKKENKIWHIHIQCILIYLLRKN